MKKLLSPRRSSFLIITLFIGIALDTKAQEPEKFRPDCGFSDQNPVHGHRRDDRYEDRPLTHCVVPPMHDEELEIVRIWVDKFGDRHIIKRYSHSAREYEIVVHQDGSRDIYHYPDVEYSHANPRAMDQEVIPR